MKVLVADDSPVLRAAVTKLLEPAGYEVVTAEDGVEAITRVYEERPDLILLDVQMPKLTGYVVCRLIKEDPATATIPVLILTVRNAEEDRYWGAQSGADGYLTKEALGEGLVTSIKSVLATRALSELSSNEMTSPPVLAESDVLTRVCEMLDRKLFEATVVNELTAIGNKPLDLPGTIEEVLKDIRRLVAFDAGSVTMAADATMYVRGDDALTLDELTELHAVTVQKFKSVAGLQVETDDVNIVRIGPHTNLSTDEGESGWDSFYGVPLRVRGEFVGLLMLSSRRSGAFTSGSYRTLKTIEPAIATVIESADRYHRALVQEARSSLSSLLG